MLSKLINSTMVEMNSFMLNVALPSGVKTTITNIVKAGQLLGAAVVVIFLLIAAFQFMTGGRESVEMGKKRVICVIIGAVLCAGCTVISKFLTGSLIKF